jgi:hypothetical protein
MKINRDQLKKMIKEAIEKIMKENNPSPSTPKPSPKPIVHPGKPTTNPGKPAPRRPLGNPNVQPKPKAEHIMKENEQEMIKKIIQRFKSLKNE